MIQSDALFWIFSTIPQVLAGLVAILAAFIIFQIQRIEDHIIRRINFIIEEWENSGYDVIEKEGFKKEDLKQAANTKNFDRILYILSIHSEKQTINEDDNKIIKGQKEFDSQIRNKYYDYFKTRINETIPNLKSKSKNTAGIILITILYSILVLVFTGFIYCNFVSYIITGIGIVLLIISLWKSFDLIKESLSHSDV